MDPETTLTGPQIVFIRGRLGLNQKALAKRVGSSQAAISRRETNSEPQSGAEIMLIALLAKEAQIEVPSTDKVEEALQNSSEEAAA